MSECDVGYYNCIAHNSEGVATCCTQLIVENAPAGVKTSGARQPQAPQFIEVLPGKLQVIMLE